jgi:hypothetical protein
MLLNLIKKCGFNKNNYYIYSIKNFNLNWQSVTYKNIGVTLRPVR